MIKKFPSLTKTLISLFGMIILVSMFIAFAVWYGEWEREQLMMRYQLPSSFLAKMLALERGSLDKLMEKNETVLCTINSYSSVENIRQLSDAQKKSVPKSILPSESLNWYMLFFSESKISRIYLVDKAAIDGTTQDSELCTTRRGFFEIVKKTPVAPDGYYTFVLRVKNREIK